MNKSNHPTQFKIVVSSSARCLGREVRVLEDAHIGAPDQGTESCPCWSGSLVNLIVVAWLHMRSGVVPYSRNADGIRKWKIEPCCRRRGVSPTWQPCRFRQRRYQAFYERAKMFRNSLTTMKAHRRLISETMSSWAGIAPKRPNEPRSNQWLTTVKYT